MIEYFGPLLIHFLVFYFPTLFYGEEEKNMQHSFTQKVAFGCVFFHYLKREYESIFVHRFSNATMPFTNVFKNSFHYWILGGIAIAYFIYHPRYVAPFSDEVVMVAAAIFILAEIGNLHSHFILRNLRPFGSTKRAIPYGGLFSLVSCANYTYEILAWLTFAIFTQTLTAYIFLVVSFVQIVEWALKKHQAYKQEFAEYSKLKRKVLIPLVW